MNELISSASPKPESSSSNAQPNRRRFLGSIGALAAGVLAVPTAGAAQSDSAENAAQSADIQEALRDLKVSGNSRVRESFKIRLKAAIAQANVSIPLHQTNGDQQRYPDGSATYTKSVEQDSIGLVNPAAYKSFTRALASGLPSDFEDIMMGGTRKLNGPQGGLAFTLEGTDSHQFGSSPSPDNQETSAVVPVPPPFASPAWGTELTELYWASLLRDVPFTDYTANPIAAAACSELTSMPAYTGPRDSGSRSRQAAVPGQLSRRGAGALHVATDHQA